MARYLTLALLPLAFVAASIQAASAGGVPKECVPVLRIPAESYVPYPALLSPPQPVAYSTYYYELYDTFCRGKPMQSCIWSCEPVVPVRGVVAGF